MFSKLLRATAIAGVLAILGGGLMGMSASPAGASLLGSFASVSPHDTVAGTTSDQITFSVYSDTGPVTAVRVVRPSTWYTVLGGSAPNWTTTASADGYETFTGFALAAGQTGSFVVDIAVGRPAQDTFGDWTVLTSSDGGSTYQVAQGANNTENSLAANIRVLSMSHPAISPSEDNGTLVTEGEQATFSTIVTNEGTGTIQLCSSGCAVTGVEANDLSSGGALVGTPPTVGPGQSAVIQLSGVTIGSNVGSSRHLRTTITSGDGQALQAEVNVVNIGTPAPYIRSAVTGFNGTYDTINLLISEPVSGTYNVNNWRVVDNQGVAHPVFNLTGSGSAYWVLELSPTPGFTSGWTATVTYTPGDLHDSAGNALPQTSIQATSGTAY